MYLFQDFGEYANWILRLFNLSIHVCVLLTEEEEEEVCPRAALSRDKITITIIAIIIMNNNNACRNAYASEENAKIRKWFTYNHHFVDNVIVRFLKWHPCLNEVVVVSEPFAYFGILF